MVIETEMALDVVADEVPVPVIVQVGAPCAVKVPAGKFKLHKTCVPETAPANVPLIFVIALPPLSSVNVRVNAPVGLEPLCVAAHVAGLRSLTTVLEPNVPTQAPVKSSPEGPVTESESSEPHPDARTAATMTATAVNRNFVTNVMLCSGCVDGGIAVIADCAR